MKNQIGMICFICPCSDSVVVPTDDVKFILRHESSQLVNELHALAGPKASNITNLVSLFAIEF